MFEMVAIKTTSGDNNLFARNARTVEGLLAEEVADSKARVYTWACSLFREYCEEVKREASQGRGHGGDLPGNGVGEGISGLGSDGVQQNRTLLQELVSWISFSHGEFEGDAALVGHQEETWEVCGQEGAGHSGGCESSF